VRMTEVKVLAAVARRRPARSVTEPVSRGGFVLVDPSRERPPTGNPPCQPFRSFPLKREGRQGGRGGEEAENEGNLRPPPCEGGGLPFSEVRDGLGDRRPHPTFSPGPTILVANVGPPAQHPGQHCKRSGVGWSEGDVSNRT
jgi:hypothetical protein